MKRHVWVTILLFISNLLLFGSEATIERVDTFQNDSKTSVVIHYSGVERMKFFALDTADGVFTLDFPGVYSKFDFAALNFYQVSQVQQLPLDPDGNAGISVRFFLEDNVKYHLFDQGAGELTVFFEVDEFESAPLAEAAAPTENTASKASTQKRMVLGASGKPGKNTFHKLDIDVQPNGGRLFLTVDQIPNYKSFFLENPKRFVLDLNETVLTLEENVFNLDQTLVQNVRIRQFQVHPKPITRMVLDLNASANVSVASTDEGLMVAYAADYDQLNGMLETPAAPMAQDETTTVVEADVVKVEPRPETAVVVADPEPVPVHDVVDAPAVVDMVIPQPQAPVRTQPLGVSQLVSEQNDVAEEVVAEEVAQAAPALEAPEVVVEDVAPKAAEFADLDQDVALQSEVQVQASEPVAHGTVDDAEAASEPIPGAELVADVVVEAPAPTPAEALTESFDATEAEAVPGSELVADVVVEAPVPTPAEDLHEDALDVQTVAEAPAIEPVDTRVARAAAPPAPLVEEPLVTAEEPIDTSDVIDLEAEDAPRFMIAGDRAVTLADIEDLNEKQTIYGMMKDVRSYHKNRKTLIVTNAAIEAGKKLGEMRPIQDDGSEDEFTSLFSEELEESVGYETIAGGEREYKGFEISIIDVKDANVVDLLRFIADQVGINLYVDSSVGDLTATYRFRNIPWDQALDIILTNANLDKEYRNGVLRVATTEKFRNEEAARAELIKQRELSVPTTTVTFPLGYAKVEDVVPIISRYLSPRGSILPDVRTNTLIIEDIPQKMNAIRALIKRLDTRIPQVSIEARIVETQKRFLKELGIQWGLSAQYSPELGTDTGVDFPRRLGVGGPTIGSSSPGGLAGGYAVNFPVVAENTSGLGLTLGNFLDNFKLDISLQMLESEGYGNLISSPKVVAQNNNLANIRNGQTIPVQTVQRGTITTRFIDAVLQLSVRPQITSDDTVIMEIEIEKSEPDFSRTVGGIPVINVQEATTKVLVKNGGTAVIGGIFTINEQGLDQGIPGLRKVPFVRRLFGGERFSYDNRELLIFITPRIVKY